MKLIGAVLLSVCTSTSAAQRIVPTADVTLYVAPTGSDSSGTGTQGVPFATPQRAVDELYKNYDLQGKYAATIQLVAATTGAPNMYCGVSMSGKIVGQAGGVVPLAANTTAPPVIVGKYKPLTIQGDLTGAAVPGAFIIPGYNGCPQTPAVTISDGASLKLRGVGLSTYYAMQDIIDVFTGSYLDITNVWFGQAGPIGQYNHISVAWGSTLMISGPYVIAGSAASHIGAGGAGVTVYANTNGDPALGITITLDGANSFPAGFVLIDNAIFYAGAITWSANSMQTGNQAVVVRNGVLQTNGNCSGLPGNQPVVLQDNAVCR